LCDQIGERVRTVCGSGRLNSHLQPPATADGSDPVCQSHSIENRYKGYVFFDEKKGGITDEAKNERILTLKECERLTVACVERRSHLKPINSKIAD